MDCYQMAVEIVNFIDFIYNVIQSRYICNL